LAGDHEARASGAIPIAAIPGAAIPIIDIPRAARYQ
jgi:hypothetical protein